MLITYAPKQTHLQAVYQILQYLKDTEGTEECCCKHTLMLKAYADMPDPWLIEGLQQVTAHSQKGIWLHGEARSKLWLLGEVLKPEAELKTITQGMCALLCLKIIL